MASGMVLGLACGPFFLICSPALGGMGYLIGGAGGIIYGVTSVSGSDEHAQLIGEYLFQIDQQRDFQQEFYLALQQEVSNSEKGGGSWYWVSAVLLISIAVMMCCCASPKRKPDPGIHGRAISNRRW